MAFNTGGSFPAHLQPTQTKSLFSGNYLGSSSLEFMNQFLPDVYEQEFERYGNRSISSFLRMVSAEMPSASDLIQWTEQGRLHTRYIGVASGAAISSTTAATPITFTVPLSQPGPNITAHNYRVGQTVMLQNTSSATADVGSAGALVLKGIITAVTGGVTANAGSFTVAFYNAAALGSTTLASGSFFTTLVFGSEFAKGTVSFTEGIDAEYQSFTNKPIIIKDYYQVDGSDVAQIGWIEVTSENGANGYLWYLKSEHETRLRFEDYLEMSMVEGVAAGTAIAANTGSLVGTSGQNITGSEGFFAALEARGNVYNDFTGTGSGSAIPSASAALNEFDNIVFQLDKQGAIEENMLFVNRELSLEIDDSLAAQNSFYSGGASWGVFNNEKDMALNLGFNGWRRGSYDFYKTDWKYLNDYATRGGFQDVEGVMVPAGTSTVYDQNLGKNIKRPFLHVRYRASEADNRKMKSWVTGTVGGAYTDSQDVMRVNFLSERCLITQGANNFVLFKKTT